MSEVSKVSSNVANLSMPRGKLTFAPLNSSGVETGEVDLGNCTGLDFTPGIGYKEHMTAQGSLVTLDKKAVSEIKPTVKFTPEERSKENMALFFLGDPDKQKGASADRVEQTGASKSASYTVYLDRWIDLGYKLIKTDSISVGGTDLTDFTAGTYKVDYENGLLMIMSTNTEGITDASTQTIAFKYGTCSLPKFIPRTSPLVGRLRYRGTSDVGPRHAIEFWKVQISPDSALKMIDPTNYAGLSFTGDVFLDDDSEAHPDDPFYRMIELQPATSYPS